MLLQEVFIFQHMVGFMKQQLNLLKELRKTDPDYLVPCHCTGWKATNGIIKTMPEKFIQSSIGTNDFLDKDD